MIGFSAGWIESNGLSKGKTSRIASLSAQYTLFMNSVLMELLSASSGHAHLYACLKISGE